MKKSSIKLAKKLAIGKEKIVVLANESGKDGVIPSCLPECYRQPEVIPSCLPECY